MNIFWNPYRPAGSTNRRRNLFIVLSVIFLSFGSVIAPPKVYAVQADHIVLIVLEGIKSSTIQSGATPHLAKLAQDGVTTWSAQSITPPLTVSAMASLFTGLPVEKHRVTAAWEDYDFARSFMRSPTVFDYMDLAGGADTGIFLMDERLYQLIRPEIYVDKQVCGYTKPQCTPETVSAYIQDFLKSVTSGKGSGFWLFGVPDLLVTHFPTAARIGQKYGWDSPKYSAAVNSIDIAIDNIMKNYEEIGVLDRTMFIVTGLNSGPRNPLAKKVKKGGDRGFRSNCSLYCLGCQRKKAPGHLSARHLIRCWSHDYVCSRLRNTYGMAKSGHNRNFSITSKTTND